MKDPAILHALRARCFLGGGLSALALLILLATPVAGTGPPREVEELFSDGLEAMDFKEWQQAEELIRGALEKWPQCGGNVRRRGMFIEPYLPHFFLGLALARQGRCEEALRQLRESISEGCIQHDKKRHRELRELREICEEADPVSHRPHGEAQTGHGSVASSKL